MTLLTVKPETGRLAIPRFSNLLENFFENEFVNFNRNEFFKTPALVNIKDTKENYLIEVAAPGFKKEDISVKVDGTLLTVSAETKNESETNDDKYTRKEFNFSSFSRSFTLPKTIDVAKVSGAYNDGILVVTLPKKEEAKQTAVVDVKIS